MILVRFASPKLIALAKRILRSRYELYGRAAPLKRNEEMVTLCDAVLAIWDGASKGTKYTIDFAKKNDKALFLVRKDKPE